MKYNGNSHFAFLLLYATVTCMTLSLALHLGHTPHSFGIWSSEGWRTEYHFIATHALTDSLILTIQSELSKKGHKLSSLTHLAVTTGPGSSTGCRVAITLIKTLAQALQIPIFSVDSLTALLLPYRPFSGTYLTLYPSAKPKFHAQLWRIASTQLKPITLPFEWTLPVMNQQMAKFQAPVLAVGTWPPDTVFPPSVFPLLSAISTGMIAESIPSSSLQMLFQSTLPCDTITPSPRYAYPPTQTEPLKNRRS